MIGQVLDQRRRLLYDFTLIFGFWPFSVARDRVHNKYEKYRVLQQLSLFIVVLHVPA